MGEFVKHMACPSCGSSDGLAIYSDDSSHCFVCQKTVPSEEFKDEKKKPKRKGLTEKKRKDEMTEKVKASVTPEETESLKGKTGLTAGGYRGIRDDVLKVFGVRTELDESEEVLARYYPCTTEGELTGWKRRGHPKNFGGSIGNTGNSCDLFGQFRFKNGGKVCLIVGGEEDQLAAYQMLKDYYVSKGWDFEPVVVSPTVGETGCAKQIANQYSWFDGYSKIVIGMDTDDAGKAAIEKIIAVLPKGKTFIANWSLKDPNEMLLKGKEKQFISDFYNAKAYVPAGVLGSSELYELMIEQAGRERIPFPPFLKKLEEMLGSWELQTCGVIAAGTGAAKTTIANEIIYHLLFNTSYKTGIVSLELDGGQYAQALLSKHIHNRIASIHDPAERVRYLASDAVKEKAKELFTLPDGSNRFMVLDERNFSIEVMEEKILEMIISGGCQIIILDPVSDLFEDLPHEAAAGFMKFLKSTMKNYPVSFLLLAHIRKSSDNKGAASTGAFVPEESIYGSGSLTKSASWVAMLSRDKYNPDDTIRNTTHVVLSKNRRGAVTGQAGQIYYDSITHQMYDLDDWLNGELN